MTVICVPCLIAGRTVEATDAVGVTSVCPDHKVAAMRLCACCNYWVSDDGPLCSQCAESLR